MILQLTIIALYIVIFALRVKEREKHNGGRYVKYLYKCVITMIVFDLVVLSIPSKVFSLKIIIQITQVNQEQVLIVFGFLVLLLDILLGQWMHHFLQTIYPLKQVPWASPQQKVFMIKEITFYLYAVALAVPTGNPVVPYLYAIAMVISGGVYFLLSKYYNSNVFVVQTINEGVLFSSFVILTCIYSEDWDKATYYYIPIVIFLIISVSFFKISLRTNSIHSFLKQTVDLKNENDQFNFVWALTSTFSLNKEDTVQKLLKDAIYIQSILTLHVHKCKNQQCECTHKSVKKLLKVEYLDEKEELIIFLKQTFLLLFSIVVNSRKLGSNQNSQFRVGEVKNQKLEMINMYMQFIIKEETLKSVYHLLEIHDCDKCSFSNCFQHYCLKYLLINQIEKNQGELNSEKLQEINSYLVFESNFKIYVKVISKVCKQVHSYWSAVKKRDLDLKKIESIGSNIVSNYGKYQAITELIKRTCGQLMIVECISWKMHKEILNFEMESMENLEAIRTIVNKSRMEKNNTLLVTSLQDSKNYVVMINGNPGHIEEIIMISKNFQQAVEYNENMLLNKRLSIILPSILDEVHQKYVVEYLKNKSTSISSFIVPNQWLKTSSGSVKPIKIQVMPKIDEKNGLCLVGIISELQQMEICDQKYNTSSLYCILTDTQDKILHFSDNFTKKFQINQSVYQKDLEIHKLILQLPENIPAYFEQNAFFATELSINDLYDGEKLDEYLQQRQNVSIFINVMFKEKVYSQSIGSIREYMFVIIEYNKTNVCSTATIFDVVENDSVQSKNDQTLEQQQSSQQIEDDHIVQINSISSTTSSMLSSRYDKQFAQISDIKSQINLRKLPVSVQKYRLLLFLGFIVIISCVFVLLGINISAESKFIYHIEEVNTEKLIKNKMTNLLLAVLCTYQFGNLPPYFSVSEIGIIVPDNNNYGQVCLNQTLILSQEITEVLAILGNEKQNWSKDFLNKLTSETMPLVEITEDGNIKYLNLNFLTSLNLIIQDATFIGNFEIKDFRTQQGNKLKHFNDIVAESKFPQKQILANFFFILFNGESSVWQQVQYVDEEFVSSINSQGDDLIYAILFITVAFCIITFIVGIAMLPFLFQVEFKQQLMHNFTLSIDIKKIEFLIENSNEFMSYLENKKFLKNNIADELQNSKIRQMNQKQLQQENIGQNMKKEENTKQDFKHIQSKGGKKDKKTSSVKSLESVFSQNKQLKNSKTSSKHKSRQHEEYKEQMEEEQKEDVQIEKQSDVSTNDQLMTRLQSQKFGLQIRSKKLIMILIFILLQGFFSGFFTLSYFVTKDVFDNFSTGFQQLDVFFSRVSCLSSLLFLHQNSILFNLSMSEEDFNGQKMSKRYDTCIENEKQQSYFSTQHSGIFKDLVVKATSLDSTDYCNQAKLLNISSNIDCGSQINGIMNLGFSQVILIIYTYLQKLKVQYQSVDDSNRTAEYLMGELFDPQTMKYTVLFYSQILDSFQFFENESHTSMVEEMNNKFGVIIIILIVFIILIIIISLILQLKLIQTLMKKIIRVRFLLKCIPSEDIIKQSVHLDQFKL